MSSTVDSHQSPDSSSGGSQPESSLQSLPQQQSQPTPTSGASPVSSSECERDASPLMLATMTPVTVDEYTSPQPNSIIYVTETGDIATASGQFQPQPIGTTVLVMQRMNTDQQHIIRIVDEKKGEESAGDIDMSSNENNGEGDSAGGEGTWREYYEQSHHPITLNIDHHSNLQAPTAAPPPPVAVSSPQMSFVYEYYKMPPTSATESSNSAPEKDCAGLTAAWPATSTGGITNDVLLKSVNGGVWKELGVNQLSDLQGLFLHPQATQGLNSLVKREPEDLSHHRTGKESDQSDSRPKVILVSQGGDSDSIVVDVVANQNGNGGNQGEVFIKEEYNSGSPNGTSSNNGTDMNPSNAASIELIATPDGLKPASSIYGSHLFTSSGAPSPNPYDHIQYTSGPPTGYITTGGRSAVATAFAADPYYREWDPSPYTVQLRPQSSYTSDSTDGVATAAFMERFARSGGYHSAGKAVISAAGGLTVDLPSPDSGIGAESITPRDQSALQQQSFDYSDMCQTPLLGSGNDSNGGRSSVGSSIGASSTSANGSVNRSRPWHDFGRQNEADKIQIPKVYNQYGFQYHLETSISTNQRREDDRVTYINKGQFYGITMEYIPDPEKPPLKTQTVKSVVMLMFREEKTPEDEIKAWHFWHSRQHSVKQRILDADTKNSAGLVGCIEEVSHNAIAVYWNPMESSAKINIAVQCLSTDFSSQKGVKGLPLHIQIDTYEDPRESTVFHRGYVQVKVFCDKGAERKTRDEERRAAKRKMSATGRKKLDELYHQPCERSEFYHMADLAKAPVLFTPAEDIDKLTSLELQGFYGHDTDASGLSNGETVLKHSTSPFLIHGGKLPCAPPPTLKFHNHFPPDSHSDKKDTMDSGLTTDGTVFSSPPPSKRPKVIPPLNERVMLYVRQDADDVYTPLHVVPPTTQGLLNAIESKYKISSPNISNLYRKNKQGIIAKLDDEMIKYYCNEDCFLLEVRHAKEVDNLLDIFLIELDHH